VLIDFALEVGLQALHPIAVAHLLLTVPVPWKSDQGRQWSTVRSYAGSVSASLELGHLLLTLVIVIVMVKKDS
jgi:hypothetical protein